MLENIGNAITRSQWTDWVATRVVASHHVPNFGNAITPLTMGPIGTTSWVIASKQHLCCKTISLVGLLIVTANRTVNVLVFWGFRDQKHPQF